MQGTYGYSIVQDGSHVSCESYSQDWYLKDGAILSHGIQGRGQGFYFFFNKLEGQKTRCFFALCNMGWALGCWEWVTWEGAMRKHKLGALLKQDVFLCGMGTTASKLGCHTLIDCIMMIHPSTYLQILFYSTLLKALWICS